MSVRPRWLQRWWGPAGVSLAVNGVLLGMLVRLSAMPMPDDEMEVAVTLRMPPREAAAPRRNPTAAQPRRAAVRMPAPARRAAPYRDLAAARVRPAALLRRADSLAPTPTAAKPQAAVTAPQPAVATTPMALPAPPSAIIEGSGGGTGGSGLGMAGSGRESEGSGVGVGGSGVGTAGLGENSGGAGSGDDGGPGTGIGSAPGAAATTVAPGPVAAPAGESRGPQVAAHSRPPYPSEARSEGVQGTAVLRVRLDAGGGVVKVSVERSSGDRRLDAAAERAVREWTYRPRLKEGVAVESSLRVRVEFRLE